MQDTHDTYEQDQFLDMVEIHLAEPAETHWQARQRGATEDELREVDILWDDHNRQIQRLYDLEYWAKFTDGYYVNVYELDQSYGGPEEGGWWFQTGTVHHGFHLTNRIEAEVLVELLREKFTDEGYRSSVMPRGTDYSVRLEPTPAVNYPSERPYYE